MFFPHRQVLKAKSSNLDDPAVFEKHYRRLVNGGTVPDDYRYMVLSFLKELPPVDIMKKIVQRFQGLAEGQGGTLTEFQWWDITRDQRSLFAVFRRNGLAFSVAFFWKKTQKGSIPIPQGNQHHYVKDPDAMNGWRIDFEGNTYEQMKADFKAWLLQPPHPFPP